MQQEIERLSQVKTKLVSKKKYCISCKKIIQGESKVTGHLFISEMNRKINLNTPAGNG